MCETNLTAEPELTKQKLKQIKCPFFRTMSALKTPEMLSNKIPKVISLLRKAFFFLVFLFLLYIHVYEATETIHDKNQPI